jgi:hypothetical protein
MEQVVYPYSEGLLNEGALGDLDFDMFDLSSSIPLEFEPTISTDPYEITMTE